MGIRDKPIAPRSPWQNGVAERLIGSIRRDCLDHIIILGEAHLRHVLRSYQQDYNGTRTHLSLAKGLTADEICSVCREHPSPADPRRIAPPLRPDLIFDRDSSNKATVIFDGNLSLAGPIRHQVNASLDN